MFLKVVIFYLTVYFQYFQVYENVSSLTLVPGDVLVIPREGMVMTCDAALLTGNAIVNEAILTGKKFPL